MSKNDNISHTLFQSAQTASDKCHAPYSNFPVGAAILAENGEVYAGANIEIASFPEGWCAETTAIGHMIMDGQNKIIEVAITAKNLDECTPCGGCRQRLAEFGSADTKVHLCDQSGVTKTILLGDLLPLGFVLEE